MGGSEKEIHRLGILRLKGSMILPPAIHVGLQFSINNLPDKSSFTPVRISVDSRINSFHHRTDNDLSFSEERLWFFLLDLCHIAVNRETRKRKASDIKLIPTDREKMKIREDRDKKIRLIDQRSWLGVLEGLGIRVWAGGRGLDRWYFTPPT